MFAANSKISLIFYRNNQTQKWFNLNFALFRDLFGIQRSSSYTNVEACVLFSTTIADNAVARVTHVLLMARMAKSSLLWYYLCIYVVFPLLGRLYNVWYESMPQIQNLFFVCLCSVFQIKIFKTEFNGSFGSTNFRSFRSQT